MTYSPDEQLLETWVSSDRLTRYRAAREDTVDLYLWNATVSAHLIELIGHVEVLLRNALHSKLATHSPNGEWYLDSYYNFSSKHLKDISNARNRATKGGVPEKPGKVVAELMFGFWRYLLSNRYRATVWPRVQHAFSGVPAHERDRAKLEAVVIRVHDLRNRVAHHEPVFHQGIHQHVADLLFVAGYVDDRAARMLADQTRIFEVIAQRPPI